MAFDPGPSTERVPLRCSANTCWDKMAVPGRAAGLGWVESAASAAQQASRLWGRAGALDRLTLGSHHGRSGAGSRQGPATLPPRLPFLWTFQSPSFLLYPSRRSETMEESEGLPPPK